LCGDTVGVGVDCAEIGGAVELAWLGSGDKGDGGWSGG